jgi:hypothetical protein
MRKTLLQKCLISPYFPYGKIFNFPSQDIASAKIQIGFQWLSQEAYVHEHARSRNCGHLIDYLYSFQAVRHPPATLFLESFVLITTDLNHSIDDCLVTRASEARVTVDST